MKIKFIIQNKEHQKADIAFGDLYVLDNDKLLDKFTAVSGGFGRGFLPEGNYIIDWYNTPEQIVKKENRVAFSVCSSSGTPLYGFFFHLQPQFQCDRTELGIHCKGITPGTLGCIELDTDSQETAENFYSLISNGFKQYGKIPVYVESVLSGRKS